jgi:hypothetical protein
MVLHGAYSALDYMMMWHEADAAAEQKFTPMMLDPFKNPAK